MLERLDTLRHRLRRRTDLVVRTVQSRGLETGARWARWLLGAEERGESWTEWEYRTLSRLMHVMCDYSGDLPRPSDTFALESTLEFVETLPTGRRRQLRDLVALFEAGPLVLAPNEDRERFTELDDDDARAYLRSWETSRLPPRRAAFRALKSICMIGYWSQPETWGPIGYSLEENSGLDTS